MFSFLYVGIIMSYVYHIVCDVWMITILLIISWYSSNVYSLFANGLHLLQNQIGLPVFCGENAIFGEHPQNMIRQVRDVVI